MTNRSARVSWWLASRRCWDAPRRKYGRHGAVHRIGALTLDPSSRRVELDASPVELTRTEFDLLQAAEHPGWVLNRRQLTDAIIGARTGVGDDHLVDVHRAPAQEADDLSPSSCRRLREVGYQMGKGQ